MKKRPAAAGPVGTAGTAEASPGALAERLKESAMISARALLRPVVRLLLRCGISSKELAELAKEVYVEVATAEYGKHGRPANASRVAILTGLSRREVKRVRDTLAYDATPAETKPDKGSRAARVLSGWFQDPEFRSARGEPRLLETNGSRGFEGLTKRYAPDIPTTAMLKELKAVGAVKVTPGGRLRAAKRYYIPAVSSAAAVLRAGSVFADIGATIEHNLRADDTPTRFEGRATNVRVPRTARRAFRDFLEQRGMAFLEEVDRWLAGREGDANDTRTVRLGVGVYQIHGE